jgi:hypothetical protein
VNIQPGVGILSVLSHLNYTPWYALAEFVDNSIESYRLNRTQLQRIEGRDFQLQVDIQLFPDDHRIVIRDNAAGIDKRSYPRAFRPAAAPPDVTGLAEFGMGMKSAACWFSPHWSVRTKALAEREERTVTFDIRKIVAQELEKLLITTRPMRSDKHYTEILLERIEQRFPQRRTIGKIKEHLSSLYRTFLRDGSLALAFDGELLTFEQPKILVAPFYKAPQTKPIKWQKEVSFKLKDNRRVEGFVAIRERGSTTHAGFALLRRGRVILGSADDAYKPVEIFGAPNSFRSQRLFGELSLYNFPVSHTKDAISWQEKEDEFIRVLRAALDKGMPMLRQADGYRAKTPSVKLRKRADEAVRGAAAALSGASPHTLEILARDGQPAVMPERLPIPSRGSPIQEFSLRVGAERWAVQVQLSYDDRSADWLTISRRPSAGSTEPRQLGIQILMAHPFVVQFFGGGSPEELQGMLRLATGLAIAEVLCLEAGVRSAGSVRMKLNELLRLCLSSTP